MTDRGHHGEGQHCERDMSCLEQRGVEPAIVQVVVRDTEGMASPRHLPGMIAPSPRRLHEINPPPALLGAAGNRMAAREIRFFSGTGKMETSKTISGSPGNSVRII
jgi:hypothetical protein